jgi:hypothetical protein
LGGYIALVVKFIIFGWLAYFNTSAWAVRESSHCVNFSANWIYAVERINGAIPLAARGEFTVTQVQCRQITGLPPANNSHSKIWMPLDGTLVKSEDGQIYRARFLEDDVLVEKLQVFDNRISTVSESCRYRRNSDSKIFIWCEKGSEKREILAYTDDDATLEVSIIHHYLRQLTSLSNDFMQQMLDFFIPSQKLLK